MDGSQQPLSIGQLAAQSPQPGPESMTAFLREYLQEYQGEYSKGGATIESLNEGVLELLRNWHSIALSSGLGLIQQCATLQKLVSEKVLPRDPGQQFIAWIMKRDWESRAKMGEGDAQSNMPMVLYPPRPGPPQGQVVPGAVEGDPDVSMKVSSSPVGIAVGHAVAVESQGQVVQPPPPGEAPGAACQTASTCPPSTPPQGMGAGPIQMPTVVVQGVVPGFPVQRLPGPSGLCAPMQVTVKPPTATPRHKGQSGRPRSRPTSVGNLSQGTCMGCKTVTRGEQIKFPCGHIICFKTVHRVVTNCAWGLWFAHCKHHELGTDKSTVPKFSNMTKEDACKVLHCICDKLPRIVDRHKEVRAGIKVYKSQKQCSL